MVHSNRKLYDFNMFKSRVQSDIYNSVIRIKDAKEEQDELVSKMRDLTEYNVRNQKNVKQKQKILKMKNKSLKQGIKLLAHFKMVSFQHLKIHKKNQMKKRNNKQFLNGF